MQEKIKQFAGSISKEVWGTWTKLIIAVFASSMLLPNMFELISSLSSGAQLKASLFSVFLLIYFLTPLIIIFIFYKTDDNYGRFKNTFKSIAGILIIASLYCLITTKFKSNFTIIPSKFFQESHLLKSDIETYDLGIQILASAPLNSGENDLEVDDLIIDSIPEKFFSDKITGLSTKNPTKLLNKYKQAILLKQHEQNKLSEKIVKRLQILITIINITLLLPTIFIIGIYLKKSNETKDIIIYGSIESLKKNRSFLIVYLTVVAYLLYPVNRQLKPEMFHNFSPSTLFKLQNWNPIPEKQVETNTTSSRNRLWQISKDVKSIKDNLTNFAGESKKFQEACTANIDLIQSRVNTLPTKDSIKTLIAQKSDIIDTLLSKNINITEELAAVIEKTNELSKSQNNLLIATNSLIKSNKTLIKNNKKQILENRDSINTLTPQ